MPIRDYPFITVNPYATNPNEVVQFGGPHARPYLWLRITNPATNDAMIVPAGVDTGADGLVMPATDAETLGHTLETTQPREVRTAKGLTRAYPHAAAIEVLSVLPSGHADESKVLYLIPETMIWLTIGQKAHLVGQGSFLSLCVLKINYPEKIFSVMLSDRS